MRKRKVILLKQLMLRILPLKYLKALSARFVLLLTSTSISMTVKNVLSLSVRSALLYHKYILVIGVRLNTFALIVLIRSISAKIERRDVFVYKCDDDRCPSFLKNKAKFNFRERLLAKLKSSQFKLTYQYREYHFTQEESKDIDTLQGIWAKVIQLALQPSLN